MQGEFLTWCEQRIKECMEQQRSLSADERSDEARFMQIRANVYGIFLSVYKALRGDLTQVRQRLDSIPRAWEESLRLAEAHNETEKAHIERIKLETAQAIRHFAANLEDH